MSEVKAIIFDFGGTLDNDGVDWFVRLYDILSRRGLRLERDTFYQYARQAAEQLDEFADTRHLTMGQTVERLCERVTEIIKDLEGNGQMNWEPVQIATRFMSEAHEYLERNRSVLEQLQGRYRLGVISNNWGNTAGWCEQFQLSDYFEVMIDSTLVGSAKPDQAIFEAALAELSLPAEACVYVGDRFESDVFGAHQVGMRTVWVTGSDDKECPDESMVGHRIEKLPDILDINWVDE
jgi:HAD superfamily hydrolase (TIGR01509 family)